MTIYIEELEKCIYPNLAAEIRCHCGAHPDTYADHANITTELLEAFLRGEAEITLQEFFAMAGLSGADLEYLVAPELKFYRMTDAKDQRIVLKQLEEAETRLLACGSESISAQNCRERIRLIKEAKIVLQARINELLHHIKIEELGKKNQGSRKPAKGSRKKGGNRMSSMAVERLKEELFPLFLENDPTIQEIQEEKRRAEDAMGDEWPPAFRQVIEEFWDELFREVKLKKIFKIVDEKETEETDGMVLSAFIDRSDSCWILAVRSFHYGKMVGIQDERARQKEKAARTSAKAQTATGDSLTQEQDETITKMDNLQEAMRRAVIRFMDQHPERIGVLYHLVCGMGGVAK